MTIIKFNKKLIINKVMRKYKFQIGFQKILYFKKKIFFKQKKEILKINTTSKKKLVKEVSELFTKRKIGLQKKMSQLKQ